MEKPLVNIMGEVVDAVTLELLDSFQADTDTAYIKTINYMYGHWIEISNELQDMSKHPTHKYEKFPLIVLLEDIPIDEDGEYKTATVNMLILHRSNQKYSSSERQEKIFDRVLTKIYDSLMQQLADSHYIAQNTPENINRTRIDRKYFGREAIYGNNASIPYEYVDAIQIENMQLRLLHNCGI